MSFHDFVQKYNLKNKATSIIQIYQVFSSLGLNDVNTYLRDGPFSSLIGILNFHPSKGTPWVAYRNETYSDSYGCICPKRLSKFIIKRNGYCLYSEYQIQKNDTFCGSYCL